MSDLNLRPTSYYRSQADETLRQIIGQLGTNNSNTNISSGTNNNTTTTSVVPSAVLTQNLILPSYTTNTTSLLSPMSTKLPTPTISTNPHVNTLNNDTTNNNTTIQFLMPLLAVATSSQAQNLLQPSLSSMESSFLKSLQYSKSVESPYGSPTFPLTGPSPNSFSNTLYLDNSKPNSCLIAFNNTLEPTSAKKKSKNAESAAKQLLSIKAPTGKKRGRKPIDKSVFKCVKCGTTKTPEWRKGPQGRNTLCNACGLRYKKDQEGKE